MSKVQKAIGKLRQKTQQAEQLCRISRAAARDASKVSALNDTLNATVVEQNERLETLGANCRGYRERIADLNEILEQANERGAKDYAEIQRLGKANRELAADLRAVHDDARNARRLAAEKGSELSRMTSRKNLCVNMGIAMCALVLAQALPPLWAKLQPVIQQVL